MKKSLISELLVGALVLVGKQSDRLTQYIPGDPYLK